MSAIVASTTVKDLDAARAEVFVAFVCAYVARVAEASRVAAIRSRRMRGMLTPPAFARLEGWRASARQAPALLDSNAGELPPSRALRRDKSAWQASRPLARGRRSPGPLAGDAFRAHNDQGPHRAEHAAMTRRHIGRGRMS